jgi:hypothetical protein
VYPFSTRSPEAHRRQRMRKTLLLAAAAVVLAACDSTEPRVPAAIEVNPQVREPPGRRDDSPSRHVSSTTAAAPSTSRPKDSTSYGGASRRPLPPWRTAPSRACTPGRAPFRWRPGICPRPRSRPTSTGRSRSPTAPSTFRSLRAADTVSRAVEAQFAFAYAGHRTGTVSVDEEFDVLDGSGDYAAMEYNGEFSGTRTSSPGSAGRTASWISYSSRWTPRRIPSRPPSRLGIFCSSARLARRK